MSSIDQPRFATPLLAKPLKVEIANATSTAFAATVGVLLGMTVCFLVLAFLAGSKDFGGDKVRAVCAEHAGVRSVRRTASVFETGAVGVVCLDGFYGVIEP